METKSSKIFFTITIIIACLLTHVTSKASSSSSLCNGSVAECSSMVETEEITVIMESWSSQRLMLDQLDSISYIAMKGNQAACGGGNSGEPYSKKCPKTSSNPYKEGCSTHYKCRKDSP
ncbi:Protein RALF-like 32 [Cardamine amara subsp. amara]|uniref:Protein RALF-like 32 n=1 Tax=Cardamine amara subsp. amara TaxID=228776 RepID=A0ABD1BMA8_CARAN